MFASICIAERFRRQHPDLTHDPTDLRHIRCTNLRTNPTMSIMRRAAYAAGMMIRETGQALDRVGCRLQGNYAFKEHCTYHNLLSLWYHTFILSYSKLRSNCLMIIVTMNYRSKSSSSSDEPRDEEADHLHGRFSGP